MTKHLTKSVFLSSTYSDLKELRQKVAELLHGLSFSVILMENFPAASKSPLENSIKQLEKGCNYFILIIGARYGTKPDGEYSITHHEYRKAIEMKSKKKIDDIFIFMGSDNMLVPKGERISDDDEKRLQVFKNEINADGNTSRSFSTNEELFKAIYETFNKIELPYNSEDDLDTTFENIGQIKYTLENSLESKPQRVKKTLNKISKRFSPLFNLGTDSDSDIKHPILKGIKEDLENAIPDVVFDTNSDGKIERWKIRHVIFRVETAKKLMSAITDANALFEIGEQIGNTAAKDLFKNVINGQENKRLIPASIGAFIKLFNYWDASGGWGKLIVLPKNRTGG